jgi:hypothetical protein
MRAGRQRFIQFPHDDFNDSAIVTNFLGFGDQSGWHAADDNNILCSGNTLLSS